MDSSVWVHQLSNSTFLKNIRTENIGASRLIVLDVTTCAGCNAFLEYTITACIDGL